jgi:hypothetical protein
MFRRRPGSWLYTPPGSPGPGDAPGGNPLDLRDVLLPSELLAYWETSPDVSGAMDSVLMSPTLAAAGTTRPTVTISGPLSPLRGDKIDYPVGGPRGTATYRIRLGADGSFITGLTSSTPVGIGGGNEISFGNDANYTINTNTATATVHQTCAASWAEMNGRSALTLTSDLNGTAPLTESGDGINCKSPSLYFRSGALANTTGVPALVTGLDVGFEVWCVYESYLLTGSSFVQAPWSFSNSADASKSTIRMGICGPLTAGAQSRLALVRTDSGGTPGSSTFISNVCKADLSPHVTRAVITSNGQLWIDGLPTRTVDGQPWSLIENVNMNRGVVTNVDRFAIAGLAQGPSGFSASSLASVRIARMAITTPLSDARSVAVFKALA